MEYLQKHGKAQRTTGSPNKGVCFLGIVHFSSTYIVGHQVPDANSLHVVFFVNGIVAHSLSHPLQAKGNERSDHNDEAEEVSSSVPGSHGDTVCLLLVESLFAAQTLYGFLVTVSNFCREPLAKNLAGEAGVVQSSKSRLI